MASECLKVSQAVLAKRADLDHAHLPTAPVWTVKPRSKASASLIWSLKRSDSEFLRRVENALHTVFDEWPPFAPAPGQRLCVWNAEEHGYDRLEVVASILIPDGHLYSIETKRVLRDGALEEDSTSLGQRSAFGLATDDAPDELLFLSPSTLAHIAVLGKPLSLMKARDYKAAYRLAEGEPVLPYHRTGISHGQMCRALRCAWKFCDPASASFTWKVCTGRVRPLERLNRYNPQSPNSSDLNDGNCVVCASGQETMQHILLDCPASRCTRDRAVELFSDTYLFDPAFHNLHPVCDGRLLDRVWAAWAFTAWFVLWKARCKAYKERTRTPPGSRPTRSSWRGSPL